MNPRYQEWLDHVFNHEVKNPQWHFDSDAPVFEAPDSEIAELLMQTFLNAGNDLAEYSDAQVDQGIWYLADPSCSSFMFAIKSSEVPLPKRLKAIESIFNLNLECYAKRCTEALGHLSETGSSLNSSCYMFWDVCPITSLDDVPEAKEMQDAILNVLEKTLTIEHRACRESALHGLSEMTLWRPESVQEIIDHFLSKTKLDKQLLTYALNVRDWYVR